MTARRVVITGMGVISPIGSNYEQSLAGLLRQDSGVVRIPEWDNISHLMTRLGAPIADTLVEKFPRRATRTMGRVSLLAALATEEAVADSGLDRAEFATGSVGLAYGSTHGSSSANEEWVRKLVAQGGFLGLASTTYLKFMSHTAAVNLAMHFGITGRVLTTCAACVSASQAIGYAYEHVRSGVADVFVAGGAEELHFSHAGVFDVMHATSRAHNDRPNEAPRPFDKARDGLVVGEGAGTLVLEEYERAKRLGRRIHAEISGFGTNCDGGHVTNPSAVGMKGAMALALKDAKLSPDAIGYVNAHATATRIGDVAESQATREMFGRQVPIGSMKGNMGHTLGGCGAIEAALTIGAMNQGLMPATRNLSDIDPDCADLDYVRGMPRQSPYDMAMSNKFAFGGLNTSLIFKKI